MHDFVRDQRPAGPVGRRLVPVHGEHASQLVVGIGHSPRRAGQNLADIRRDRLDVAPSSAVGNRITVLAALAEDRLLLLGELAPLLPLQLGDGVVRLALPLIAESLVEHQRQDVVLIVLTRRLAAQDVRRAPQVRFKLLQREFHRVPCSRTSACRNGSRDCARSVSVL